MSLRVFAVVLDEPNDDAVRRLRDAYGNDFHPLNDTTALVRAEALSETIAVAAGIKGRDRIAGGVVFRLNRFYAGYTRRSVWKWLAEAEEAG